MQQSTSSIRPNAVPMDISYLIRSLFKNALIIILCAYIGGLWGFMLADYISAPTYTSTAYMIIKNKEHPDQIIADSTISKVAEQYQKTFTSTVMEGYVKDLLENKNLSGTIEAVVGTGTNILRVSATSKSPMDAFAIVKSAIQNYTEVTDYVITDYVLEEIMSPTIPTYADNVSGHLRLACLGALALFVAAAGIIVLIALLRDDVKNEKQAEKLLDIKLFATLFYEKKSRKNRKKGVLINSPTTSFLYTENIRKMAARFDYCAEKEKVKVLLITSVMENEGKTTIAANLALALAAQNKNVLLVDGDLRKPSLNKIFEKNVSEDMEIGAYLCGEQSLQNVLTKDEKNSLFYLFGTKVYRNTDKMLSSENMAELISTTRAYMDYIIIDSPPMGFSNDAELISKHCDGTFLVVRQGYARVPHVNDSVEALEKNNVKVLGCIYNAVQTKLLPDSVEYGYHYGYNYGYGYGYGRYNRKNIYGNYGKRKGKAGSEEENA